MRCSCLRMVWNYSIFALIATKSSSEKETDRQRKNEREYMYAKHTHCGYCGIIAGKKRNSNNIPKRLPRISKLKITLPHKCNIKYIDIYRGTDGHTRAHTSIYISLWLWSNIVVHTCIYAIHLHTSRIYVYICMRRCRLLFSINILIIGVSLYVSPMEVIFGGAFLFMFLPSSSLSLSPVLLPHIYNLW